MMQHAHHLVGGNGATRQVGESRQTLRAKICRVVRGYRSFRRKRRGTSVVEFAIIAPVFFLFVLGIIEYGRMVMVYQVITNASRMGARIAVLEDSTRSQIESQVDQYLDDMGMGQASSTAWARDEETGADISDFSLLETGDTVGVTVTVTFDQVSWLPSPMFLGGRELSATTQMRREGGG